MIDLTAIELFESLLIFDTENTIIDLHNDYVCEDITYDLDRQLLEISFKGKYKVTLEFKGAAINRLNILPEKTLDSQTLNNFYRGRFEVNGNLLEYTSEGKGYYYLDFEAGDSIEVYALNVFLHKEE